LYVLVLLAYPLSSFPRCRHCLSTNYPGTETKYFLYPQPFKVYLE